jgi:hypothetical protein
MNAQESGTSDCPLLELSDEHVQLVGQMASPPQIGGTYAPVSGTIRVLIIFARFSDDNYEPNNPNWKLSDTLTNFPEAQNIIDPFGTPPSNYKKGTLSHYFHKMSNGQLNFVGDVYPRVAIFPKTRLWYVQNNREFGHANAELLDSLNRDDQSLNFAIYDNNTMGNGVHGNTIYDMLGREVETLVSGVQQAGRYEVIFNASRLASGVYFYRLQAGGISQTMRMVFVK